jgi:hypothetical protein
MLFAAYIGYKGGAEGWFQDMQANGPEVLEGYGKFLAGRYQHYDNILWVQGGDYIPADRTLVDAVANGIRSVLPNALQTVHTSRGHAAMDAWPNTPWLNVNNIYTSFVVHDAAREQAARTGTPFFLIEAVYENPTPLFPTNPSATAAQVRSQAYEAVLGGAFGQIMGTNPLWYFGPGWQKGLDSGGARSLSQLYRLMSSHAWWLLQPDADALVRTGQSATAFAAGALGSDRSFALVYVPETRRVGVNLAQLAGPSVTAHWYDPTEGTLVKAVDAPLANSGVHDFDPPGRNSARDRDWVLVLESSPRSLSDQ